MSRLGAIRPATRPKMYGRAMISGPSGAGKTWTSLSMGTTLAEREDRPGEILLIDTEKESALTYADSFTFQHLPWRPPYDPTELVQVLRDLGDTYAVIIIDSLSKFWGGLGGTLDIADGKFGGWKAARPVQEGLVEAILATPAHVLLGVRSKMAYAVEQSSSGKQQVQKIGLAPQQDDNLVYEVNIALDIDLEHRITCTKSRTPAVPVGRMYPAGHEKKAAEDYADWLAGGVPPASREVVERIVAALDAVSPDEVRGRLKQEFVQRFGMPHSLTEDKAADAEEWVAFMAAEIEVGVTPDEEGGEPVRDGTPVTPTPDAEGEQ